MKTRKGQWCKTVCAGHPRRLLQNAGLREGNRGGYTPRFIETALLLGADNWMAYSEGGCSLVCSADIAKRLCSPLEIKRKISRSGMILPPNRIETWIQVQGRALNQAWRLLRDTALTVCKA